MTTWLLDVDGVINASRAGWSRAPMPVTVRAHDGNDYRLKIEPAVLLAIHQAIRAGVVVTWCSTWCRSARALERALGLPEMPVAFHDDVNGEDALWAKRDAALRAVRAGRLIWTDDQIKEEDVFEIENAVGARQVASIAGGRSPNQPLVIVPRSSYGLRPDDVRAIEAYYSAT